MLHRVITVLCLSLLIAVAAQFPPSHGAEPPKFSDEQRAHLEEIVREYLLQNPEIIREVIAELKRRDQIAAQIEAEKAVVDNQKRIFNDGVSVEIGNPDGDVTLVEFYDYQCPYCRSIHKDILRLVAEDKNLRIVMKQLPIKDAPNEFPASLLAAMMAMAADEQGRFEAYHQNVFVAAGLGKLSREGLFQVAVNSGLDLEQLQRDMENPEIMESIRDNLNLAHDIGVTGTPSYVIGERVIIGPGDSGILKTAIEELRESRLAPAASQ